MIKKPMLAGKLDNVESILFPVLATPKLDGIRCLRLNSKSVSRKLIDIPNGYIQKMMEALPDGLDGELVVLETEFNQTQSEIMSESGEPNFRYYVFDYVSGDLKKTYSSRMEDLKTLELPEFCVKLLPVTINSVEEFNNYEQVCLKNNYEGVMLRTPSGPYKCGRSTEKEAYLLKYKRFEDSDAEIIGMEALFSNENEKELDQMGYTKRSKKNSGLKEEETLGSLSVRDVHSGVEFSLGTGFTAKQRKEIWDKKGELIGKLVKYRFQPAGVKEKPRFPSFISFRDERDL